MRKIILRLLFIFLPFSINAQLMRDSTHLNTYFFEGFPDGVVLFKTGSKEHAALNYNTYDQSIVFRKGMETLTLVNLVNIDTVYIKDRKFIPVRNEFYEFIGGLDRAGLCVSYTSRLKPVVATTDHNGTSRQEPNAVSNTVSGVYLSRSSYNGAFTVEFIRHYWLKSFNDLYKSNTQKQFINAIPSYMTASAKDYIKEHQTNFKSEADVLELLQYCNAQAHP